MWLLPVPWVLKVTAILGVQSKRDGGVWFLSVGLGGWGGGFPCRCHCSPPVPGTTCVPSAGSRTSLSGPGTPSSPDSPSTPQTPHRKYQHNTCARRGQESGEAPCSLQAERHGRACGRQVRRRLPGHRVQAAGGRPQGRRERRPWERRHRGPPGQPRHRRRRGLRDPRGPHPPPVRCLGPAGGHPPPPGLLSVGAHSQRGCLGVAAQAA